MLKVFMLYKHKIKKMKINIRTKKIASTIISVIAVSVLLGTSLFIPNVSADNIANEIQALREENARNRAALADLSLIATSYKDAINKLEAQIGQLQAQINENLARQADLRDKIEKGQRELEHQRMLLSADIKAMYSDGEMSTIEMLATSKDLSDFVDKEAYRSAVQKKIQDTLRKVNKLQKELTAQKEEVELLLKQQQEQQFALNTSRAEQTRMLTLNQQQQSEFNRKTSDNQARIDDLIEQQRRANEGVLGGYYFIRFPGAVRDHNVTVDDYPYRNAGFSMQLGPCSNFDSYPDSPDEWGYCTRQCVSYAAWAVKRSGRAAPIQYGNAKDWVLSAPSAWVHRDPKPGDVAISTGGTWGHAMYVERVDGDRIYVSQYNSQLTGQYSTQWRTFR